MIFIMIINIYDVLVVLNQSHFINQGYLYIKKSIVQIKIIINYNQS